MNIVICENLKELRKNKNITQEDLAAFLDVSISAVSKWERDECYPDIELLPKLAAYYNISVDELLGVGEINKKKRIEEYEEKSMHLRTIGDRKGDLELLLEAQKEFPNDWTILSRLMYALFNFEQAKNAQEIIKIGDKILAECTDNNYRYGAMQVLCYLYKELDNIEKAEEYARMAPSYNITSNELFIPLLKGEEAIRHCQYNITNMIELIVGNIGWYRRQLKDDDAKYALQMQLKFYELLYEDGDFHFYCCRIAKIYSTLVELAIEKQDKDEMLEHLSNAVKYTIQYDTLEDVKPHTSFLVNRISYKRQNTSRHGTFNESFTMLEKLNDKRYDFCRDDIRFAKLVDDLKKVAKENATV